MKSNVIRAAWLALACAAAGCTDTGSEGEATGQETVSARSGDAQAVDGSARVVLSSLADDELYGLQICQIGLKVSNATGKRVRSISIQYYPRGADYDEMIAHAGGEMTAFIKDIPHGTTVDDQTEIRGMACDGLAGIDVVSFYCRTTDGGNCTSDLSIESSIDGVVVERVDAAADAGPGA